MNDPVVGADRNVFGANSTYHDLTGMPLETGVGAPTEDHQALQHCNIIEARGEKEKADTIRGQLNERIKNPEHHEIKAAKHRVELAEKAADEAKSNAEGRAAELEAAHADLEAVTERLDEAKKPPAPGADKPLTAEQRQREADAQAMADKAAAEAKQAEQDRLAAEQAKARAFDKEGF